MTTKHYASNKERHHHLLGNTGGKPGSKMIKRALRHNLDGTKQFTSVTMAFNQMKQDKHGKL